MSRARRNRNPKSKIPYCYRTRFRTFTNLRPSKITLILSPHLKSQLVLTMTASAVVKTSLGCNSSINSPHRSAPRSIDKRDCCKPFRRKQRLFQTAHTRLAKAKICTSAISYGDSSASFFCLSVRMTGTSGGWLKVGTLDVQCRARATKPIRCVQALHDAR